MSAITSCGADQTTPTRYLRQLSLDLRGAPPTDAEYAAVAARGAVTPDEIDGMLRDPRFVERVKSWHADLIWPSIAGFEFRVGGGLVVTPPRNTGLTQERTNPEWLVQTLDARTDEATCPAPSDPANLTASSCCTAADPNHPSCCLVRNAAFDANDPACVAKAAALPATFNIGPVFGDRELRGGDTYLGCDFRLEYPLPRVAADDRRWLHEADGRPYYVAPRSGQRRYYYDEREIPLPYDDATHCPNYCRAARASGPGGAWATADYTGKTRTVAGVVEVGDGPGFACPAGFTEVTNPCDNVVAHRPQSRWEIRQEGWHFTRPYWASDHLLKVCAYEGQERDVSLNTRLPCRPGQVVDNSCGCGPALAWCGPFTGELTRRSHTLQTLLDAVNREPLEILASVIDRDEDYATIFTTRRGMANGALAYMNRHQTEQMGELDFSPSAPPDALPDVPWSDATWHPYERAPQHSGILTTPVYLARFGTLRSRINRFRTAFLCQPFVPSDVPPPPVENPCHKESNLARRCGCQYCHTSIEPLGAAWGRWAERATNYLDPAEYPVFDPRCATCIGTQCPRRCRNYLTTPLDGDSAPFLGTLQVYLYRGPDEVRRIEAGPSSLVVDALATGQLQSCTVRTAWSRLLNRPMSGNEEREVLPALVRDFDLHGRSYRALVRAIVTSPTYRRVD